MTHRIISLILFCSALTAQASLKDTLEPAHLKGEIKKKIASISLKADLKLFDVELFDSLSLSAKYRYQLEPSYQDGYYSRVDGWTFKVGLSPGDLLEDLPVSFKIEQGAEVFFVRQFKNQWDAAKALPVFDPRHIPFNADLATRFLQPGDFVRVPATLSIVLGANVAYETGIIKAKLSSHYLLRGEFIVDVFKVDADHVRMRLIPKRSREIGINASVRATFGFDVFGINIVDKAVRQFLKLDIADIGLSFTKGDLFLVDYVYDLRSQEARDAYDAILGSALKFKTLEILNPFASELDLTSALVSDISAADALFVEDRNAKKEPKERRVNRIFRGKSHYEQRALNVKVGGNIFKFKKGMVSTDNFVTYVDKNDQKKHFFFPSYSRSNEKSVFFGLLKANEQRTVGALFETNEDRSDYTFSDYVVNFELKDKELRPDEVDTLRDRMVRNLPAEVTSKIDWGTWAKNDKGWRKDARVNYQLIIRKDAIDRLIGLNQKTLSDKFYDYLKTVPIPKLAQSPHDLMERGDWLHQQRSFIYEMTQKMAFAFINDSTHSEKERIEAFMALRSNSIFTKFGVGFLLRLLEKSNWERDLYLTIQASSDDDEPLRFTYGDQNKSELFLGLQRIQSILNNRTFDLRLETETGSSDGI